MNGESIMQNTIIILEGIILLGIIILYFFIPSYINKKGENLATKEDIAEITDKVEGVKHQYELMREQFRTKSQLRLAAIDKRLEIHQRCFTLWRKLLSKVHNREEVGNMAIECQKWWNENCLYLEPEVRKTFRVAFNAAFNHSDIKAGGNSSDIMENYKLISEAGDAILRAVELPSIGELEEEIDK